MTHFLNNSANNNFLNGAPGGRTTTNQLSQLYLMCYVLLSS